MPWEKIAQGSAMVLGKFVTTPSSSWWLALDLIPSVIDKKEVGLRDGSALVLSMPGSCMAIPSCKRD